MKVPAFFWPLAAYGALTIVSAVVADHAARRIDPNTPRVSLEDCKQLVLFLMVPMVARLTRGEGKSG